MTRLRTAGAGLSDAPMAPRLRVAGVSASAEASISQRLRVAGVGASGDAVPQIRTVTVTPRPAEPRQLVTVTAILAPGSVAPDLWTFTQTAGAPVELQGSGPVRTYLAPAVLPSDPASTALAFSVTAHLGGASTSLVFLTSVYVCLEWSRVHGGPWVGAGLVGAN